MIKTIHEMLQVSTPRGQRQAEKNVAFLQRKTFFCDNIQMCWLELYSLLRLGNRAGASSKYFLSTWYKTCDIYWTNSSSMYGWQQKLTKLFADATTQLILLLCSSQSLLCTSLYPPVAYFRLSPNTFFSILFSDILILRSFPSSDKSNFTPIQGS